MAFPTAVNDQITDSVTQSNVKVIAESPAFAMSSIYQSLAHSTGILFENAVAAQQQQNTLAMAATNQGIMQIYSLDTTAAAGATDKVAQTGVADNLTSLLTVLNAMRNPTPAPKAVASAPETVAADATPQADTAKTDATASDHHHEGVAEAIRSAVHFSNDTVLGHGHAVVAGVKEAADALAHAIDEINRVSHANLVRTIEEAALAAVLALMIRQPEKAKDYDTVLQAIKQAA